MSRAIMDVYAQARYAPQARYTPPPAQAMDADPTVVDAAVRFCDDVLASPNVTVGSRVGATSKIPMKVKVPIMDSSGEEVLSMVFDVPELYEWHGSIVTAEGVSVARMSDKSRAVCCAPKKITAPVPIEWGGARFGEVNEAPTKCHPCVPHSEYTPSVVAHGPGHRIYLSMAEINPTKVKLCTAACWLLPLGIIPGFFVFLGTCCIPDEIGFRDGSGEGKVIGKRISSAPCAGGCHDHDPYFRESVLHFEDMTPEQRRLALVALMYLIGDSEGVSRPVPSG